MDVLYVIIGDIMDDIRSNKNLFSGNCWCCWVKKLSLPQISTPWLWI